MSNTIIFCDDDVVDNATLRLFFFRFQIDTVGIAGDDIMFHTLAYKYIWCVAVELICRSCLFGITWYRPNSASNKRRRFVEVCSNIIP